MQESVLRGERGLTLNELMIVIIAGVPTGAARAAPRRAGPLDRSALIPHRRRS